MLTKPSLTLKRRLKATPAQVFAAWTDPEKIVQWFGPRETVPGSVQADMDVRAGGRYAMRFTTADGESHKVGGVYREVSPPSRLVFSWAWQSTPERESLVTVTIAPNGKDACLLTLHHEQFFDEAARTGHERGWTGTLEKLERYFS